MAHPMSEFLGTVMIVIVLWFGGTLVLAEYPVISGPTFIYYLVILNSIINPLKDFSKASYNIPKGLASMERVDKILKAEVEIQEKAQPEHISSFEHEIEFRHVSFAYNDHGKQGGAPELHYVLRDINLVIPKGKTIALVGQSGSGKSTLAKTFNAVLLPSGGRVYVDGMDTTDEKQQLEVRRRDYDVQEGEVLIDGINVKDLGIHDLRQLIGNVNQEAILFNDTFRNNISFGVEGATEEEIIHAAKIANAHDFIMQSDHGYDTNIGDRGGSLSR